MRKKSKFVKFDKEVVTKDAAQDILSKLKQNKETNAKNHEHNEEKTVSNVINNNEGNFENQSNRKLKKRKKLKNQSDGLDKDSIAETQEKPERKKKKRNQQPPIEESSEIDQEQSAKTAESKRALKRKRKAQLFAENKLNHELKMQQQSLNYLSKWKHSRDDWKFEKLRQVWLQHNMFDVAKIPNEFWTILVEYFSGSKGLIRKTILEEATKLIEKENEDSENNDEIIRIQRARDIVQCL